MFALTYSSIMFTTKQKNNRLLIILLSAVFVISLGFIFWVHYSTLEGAIKYTDLDKQTDNITNISDELFTGVLCAEIEESDYLLNGDKKNLRLYNESKRTVMADLDELRKTVKNSSVQQIRIDSLTKLCALHFSSLDEEIAYKNDNLNEEDRLIENRANIRTLINSFNVEEDQLLSERASALDKNYNTSFKTLLRGDLSILTIFMCFFIVLGRQINKRQKAQNELFVSREFLSQTLLCMGDGVIITDKDGNIMMMNKIAEELAGSSINEAKGHPIENICTLEDEHTHFTVENPVKRALKEKQVVFLEHNTLMVKKGKTNRYIDDSAAPIIDSEGNITGAVMVFRDVTQKTLNQRKLVQNEQLLRDIIDNTRSVIYIKDLEGNFLMVNKQYERVFEVKSADILGSDSYARFPGEIAAKFKTVDKNVLETGRAVENEQLVQHTDNSYHHYHTTKFPLYGMDGGIYAICGVSTDISESKKNIEIQEKLATQETLLKSEARLKEAQAIAHVGNWEHNFAKNIGEWSEETCRIYGLSPDDNKQSFESWISFQHPDDLPRMRTLIKEAAETLSNLSFYHRIVRKDGTIRHVYTQANYELSSDGAPISIRGVIHDITDMKEMENETLQLVENLQKRNKDLQVFAYMISHNLRSSIAKITGLSYLLENEQETASLDMNLVERIKYEVDALDMVVKDINTIITARDTGKIEPEYISFDAKLDLVKKVLENNINESKALITNNFKEAEGVFGSKTYLYSIIYNLLSNAIKYRSENKSLHIDLQSHETDNYVCLTVKDNGMGIDLDKNGDKLFGLYKRFHTGKIPGRGIGLNLVKTHVESLGGKIEVESKINEGTTFNVYIPKTK